jgi:Ca2+-binding RTX toxin-like protein
MADIVGDGTSQSLYGTSGADTIQGLGGDDWLYGFDGNDVLEGGGDNDVLQGGFGLDQHYGGDGNDTFYVINQGEAEAGEIYDGGAGTDRFEVGYYAANSHLPLDLTAITITGFEDFYAISGSQRLNVKLTLDQVQQFTTIAGTITLATGGSLNLSGRSLDAYWYLSDQATTIDFTGSISQFGDGALVISGAGNDAITGTALNDYLEGNGGNDTLIGGEGNDTLKGGAGLDVVQAGGGDDEIRFGAATDLATGETIDGGSGYDKIHIVPDPYAFGPFDFTTSTLVGIEELLVEYSSGGVRLTVAQLSALQKWNGPILVAGTGTLSLAGKDAGNSAYALEDTVTGFDATGVIGTLSGVYAGGNDNTLTGYDGFDYFDGGGGNDTITGFGGDDQLLGKAGNDTITGGDGADQLSGGDGIDQLYGGDGDDVLRVESIQAVTGEVYDGGAGHDKLDLNGGTLNLSQQSITGIEWLDAGPYSTVTLSVAQFAGFSTLQGHFAIAAAGTVSFAGKTLYNFQLDTSAAGNTVDLTGSTISYANIYAAATISSKAWAAAIPCAARTATIRCGAGPGSTRWRAARATTFCRFSRIPNSPLAKPTTAATATTRSNLTMPAILASPE